MLQGLLHFFIFRIIQPIINALKTLTPLGDLAARIWIAKIFFDSGLTKINNWDATVALFTNLYQVPLLSPLTAAYVGTAAELILPVLLLVGLGSRVMILIFFIYNITCVISYNFLWTPAGMEGLDDHILWGLLLAMLMFHGPGKLSLDHLIAKHYKESQEYLD